MKNTYTNNCYNIQYRKQIKYNNKIINHNMEELFESDLV